MIDWSDHLYYSCSYDSGDSLLDSLSLFNDSLFGETVLTTGDSHLESLNLLNDSSIVKIVILTTDNIYDSSDFSYRLLNLSNDSLIEATILTTDYSYDSSDSLLDSLNLSNDSLIHYWGKDLNHRPWLRFNRFPPWLLALKRLLDWSDGLSKSGVLSRVS